MRIIRNEKLIKRNGKIGQWSSLAGLAVLAGGFYLSIRQPERSGLTLAALLVGFLFTQMSSHFATRFGRSPRPDERLDTGLKGLPGDFVLYHYATPASHLLVGPAGIWVLLPYHLRGTVTLKNNRWRLSGGGFLQSYLRIFGQQGLGNPSATAAAEVGATEKYLERKLPGVKRPETGALVVFTEEDIELDVETGPVQVLKVRQLKELMRREAKDRRLSGMELSALMAALGPEQGRPTSSPT